MNILMRQRKKYGWPVIGNLPITGATEPSKFRIMAERKVKPEIMHLMILSKCNYKCENNTHFVYYGWRTIHGKYRS